MSFATAAAVVAADQVTTSLAEAHLRGPVHVLGPFGLALGYNSGSAFSLFTGQAAVLAVVAVVLIGVLSWLCWRAATTGLAAGLGLLTGGAVGNLCDRVCRGHHGDVVDFITLTHWPTFNVADVGITAGVIVLVVVGWRVTSPGHRADNRAGEGALGDR